MLKNILLGAVAFVVHPPFAGRKLVVACALALPLSASAQEPILSIDALRGIEATNIMVMLHSFGGDDVDAIKACHLDEASLDAAIRLPLSTSRLRIKSTARDVIAHVGVYVTASAAGCVGYVNVDLYRWADSLQARAMVWQRRYGMTGPPLNFGERVGQTIEGFTKILIAEWLKANEP